VQRPQLGDDLIAGATVAAESGVFRQPRDSTPDAEATVIYFTATGAGGPGVFRVPFAGGTATEIASGAPFVAPRGIAISGDDRLLYVADPQSGGAGGKAGQIFVVPVGGGPPAVLRGSEGFAPRGLDVARQGDREAVYFTGKDPNDGQAGVFKLAGEGGTPAVVAKGAPFVEPDGVAVTRAGDVYVTDRVVAGAGAGSVFKIAGGTVTRIVDRVRTGDPAGVALTLDESVLLVSALQAERDRDQVLLVDLKTLQTGSVTKVVGENKDAGGVHRARNRNLFSWADSTAGPSGGGKVYGVSLR
jgi:DNA-binding beta-propeller fold protein YncE